MRQFGIITAFPAKCKARLRPGGFFAEMLQLTGPAGFGLPGRVAYFSVLAVDRHIRVIGGDEIHAHQGQLGDAFGIVDRPGADPEAGRVHGIDQLFVDDGLPGQEGVEIIGLGELGDVRGHRPAEVADAGVLILVFHLAERGKREGDEQGPVFQNERYKMLLLKF